MTPPDPAALEALLSDCDWLRQLARSLVRDPHRADDAVQDTLLAAVRHAETRGRPKRGWLATVLRNFVRQDARGTARRERRERAAGRPEGQPGAGETAARLEVQQRVVRAVSELDEPYRTVLVQRFLDGLPPREIAKRAGVPVKTVHTRLERAKAQLRARLDREYGGDGQSWALALVPLLKTTGSQLLLASTGAAVVSSKIKIAAGVAALATTAWVVRPLVAAIGVDPDVSSVASQRPVDAAVVEPRASSEEGKSGGRAAPIHSAEPRAATVDAAIPTPLDESELSAPTVAVRVRARDGLPLRAQVTVHGSWSGTVGFIDSRTITESGVARFEVPSGRRLWVQARMLDEAGPSSSETRTVPRLAAGDEHEVELILERGLDGHFAGRVVAADGEHPIAGALVRCLWNGDETTTGADGRFEVMYSSWREAQLRVTHHEYSRTYVELGPGPMAVPPAADGVCAIRLTSAATLEAWVRARDVEAGPGLSVRLSTDSEVLSQPPGLATHERPSWAAECDSVGWARFASLPAHAPLGVEVWRGSDLVWRDPQPLEFEPGERRTLTIALGDGPFVHGTVRDQYGRAVALRELWILPVTESQPAAPAGKRFLALEHDHRGAIALALWTDEHGRFEARGLRPGTWWIGPAPIDGQPHGASDGRYLARDDVATFAEAFTLVDGESQLALDLEVDRGLYLRGVVQLDEPVGELTVRANQRESHGNLSVRLDAPGPFTIGPLRSGSYSVTASCFTPGVMTRPAFASAHAGDSDVELALDLSTGIAGTVVDAETGEAVDAHVHLVIEGSGSYGMGLDGARGPGEFRFAGLQAGAYGLKAETGDGRVGAVGGLELLAGARIEDVDIPVAPGARLRVRFEGPHAAVRCAILANGVFVSDQTVRHGRPDYHGVPAGAVLVVLFQGSWSERDVLAERAVDVESGDYHELDFELTR